MSKQTVKQVPTQVQSPWWLLLINGIIIFFLGWLLLSRPISTTILLVQVLGFYWLFAGMLNIIKSFFPESRSSSWGWQLLGGIVGIIAGLFVLNNQLFATVITPIIFTYFVAFSFILNGIVEMFTGDKGAHSKWGSVFLGLFYVILGILLLAMPLAASIATVVFTFGILAMFGGITVIILSISNRKK